MGMRPLWRDFVLETMRAPGNAKAGRLERETDGCADISSKPLGSHSKERVLLVRSLSPAVVRRGKKKAIVAVAHRLLVIIYHMPQRSDILQELGPDHFNKVNATHVRATT